jgi:hypothetical protein
MLDLYKLIKQTKMLHCYQFLVITIEGVKRGQAHFQNFKIN